MTPHDIDPGIEEERFRRDGASRCMRQWRAPVMAALIALALQTLLLLGMAVPLRADERPVWSGDELTRVGYLHSRPPGKEGTWLIEQTSTATPVEVAFVATERTEVVDGLVAGDCIAVQVMRDAPSVARTISDRLESECGDSADDGDGDNGSGDDADGFGDDNGKGVGPFRHHWEGAIATLPSQFPVTLLGEWSIVIGENKLLTFTTDIKTRLNPNLPTAFAVGQWVEVRVKRNPDGSLVAQRLRVDDYEVGEIVVRVENASISDTIAAKYGLVLTSTLLNNANIYLFTTASENEQLLAESIAREEGVIWAEVNYVNGVPEDDGYKTWGWGGKSEPNAYFSQSAYQQIRLGQSSRIYQGEGSVVAVLDTGIYTMHEQFVGKLRLPSLDVTDDDDDASEEGPGLAWGHGTHVAGVIAAMAPKATILPVRVLDENGRGNTFLLAYAIEWVTQQPGVKVINLSLGTEFDSKILRDAIQKAINQGIIVVAAAGNSGASVIQYPAGYPDVVAVTAVDEHSVKASFANYGLGWVDMAAPGVGIMSTMINEDGPGYATWSGTSMATAFVAGAAALAVQKWDVSALTGGMINQLVDSGLVVDALNPLFAGQIGRQLDVSAALGVDAELLYVPHAEK